MYFQHRTPRNFSDKELNEKEIRKSQKQAELEGNASIRETAENITSK